MIYELTYELSVLIPRVFVAFFLPGIQNCWRIIPNRHVGHIILLYHYTCSLIPKPLLGYIFSVAARYNLGGAWEQGYTIHVTHHRSVNSIPRYISWFQDLVQFDYNPCIVPCIMETEIWNAGNKSVPYTCTQMWFLGLAMFSVFSYSLLCISIQLLFFISSPSCTIHYYQVPLVLSVIPTFLLVTTNYGL